MIHKTVHLKCAAKWSKEMGPPLMSIDEEVEFIDHVDECTYCRERALSRCAYVRDDFIAASYDMLKDAFARHDYNDVVYLSIKMVLAGYKKDSIANLASMV